MAETNPPKQDRIGNDYHVGPNPSPGGDIDLGDSAVPPYDGRSTGDGEVDDGVARAMGSKEPLKEPVQPGSDAEPDPEGAADRMPPKGVGESLSRRGEDIADHESKEPGREDTGTHESSANRPTGESTPRDKTSIDPHDADSSDPS